MEIWRDIPDWEGTYQVSNLGRVRSVDRIRPESTRHGGYVVAHRRGRILRPDYTQKGYQVVALSDLTKGRRPKSFRVHRLVCRAFHGPQPEGHEVAHEDGTRDNNAAVNLRWATHRENMQDAARAGTIKGRVSRQEVCHR